MLCFRTFRSPFQIQNYFRNTALHYTLPLHRPLLFVPNHTLHQPHIFVSDTAQSLPGNANRPQSINTHLHQNNFSHHNRQSLTDRIAAANASLYITPIFRVRPEYSRMKTFTPATDVEASIQNGERRSTRTPFKFQVLPFS